MTVVNSEFSSESTRFRLEGWHVDSSDHSLSDSEGRKVRLEPKVMEVLLLLVEKRGQVVTKEELLNEIWPDTFVAEVALSRCISQLRSALGDDARNPRYIETIPKKGYRLVAPVSETRGIVPYYPGVRISLGILAALALSVFVLFMFWPAREQDSQESSLPTPLTSYHGEEYDASFSPSGDEVAFNWNGEERDNWDIYVKQISGTGEMRLTTDPALDHSPAWSPDGLEIAFARNRPPDFTEIILVPSRGGTERVVARIDCQGLGRILAWTPDGKGLAVRARTSPMASYAIHLLSLDSGRLERLTEPSEGYSVQSDSHPAFSPDGRALAFSRAFAADVSQLFVVPLSENYLPSGPARQLTTEVADHRHPVWTPNSQELLYIAALGGRSALYRLGVHSPAEPTRLSTVGIECTYPALAPDGSRLVTSAVKSDTNLFRVPLPKNPAGRENAQLAPERWISSTLSDRFARYSPDGSRIAFVSQRSGTEEIWLADSNGENLRQLTSFSGPSIGFPSWAPDGRQLACHLRAEQTDIYIVDAQNGKTTQLTNHPSLDGRASWSRDGQAIYFRSYRTGREEIWKQAIQGGEPHQITATGGSSPVEGSDGHSVYYTRLDEEGWVIWKTAADESEPQRVVGPIVSGSSFLVLDRGIYFLTSSNNLQERAVCFLEFETNEVNIVLSDFDGVLETVSPDQRWLVLSRREHPESDLLMWEKPF